MKVIFSSEGDNLDSVVNPRFGRCSKFVVVDTDTLKTEVVDNPAGSTAHGAGTLAAQKVIDLNADAVVTGHVGPNAFMVLKTAEVKMYSYAGGPVKDALDLLKQNKITEITEPGEAHHGGAGTGGQTGNRARYGGKK